MRFFSHRKVAKMKYENELEYDYELTSILLKSFLSDGVIMAVVLPVGSYDISYLVLKIID